MLQVPDTRHDPSPDLGEREMLIAFLDNYRETVLIKLDGLSREALVQRVASSRTSLLGIVKHLIHVEERWFDAAIGGAPMRTREPDDRDAEWLVDEDETAEDLATRYRVMWARSNEIARAASLDEHRRAPIVRRLTGPCAGFLCTCWRRRRATPATPTSSASSSTAAPATEPTPHHGNCTWCQ